MPARHAAAAAARKKFRERIELCGFRALCRLDTVKVPFRADVGARKRRLSARSPNLSAERDFLGPQKDGKI